MARIFFLASGIAGFAMLARVSLWAATGVLLIILAMIAFLGELAKEFERRDEEHRE